jgi:hypothetical protein
VVGIVLRSLDDLERVLSVVGEVIILKPLPLRVATVLTEIAYYPPFNFSTSVQSIEMSAIYSKVISFDIKAQNIFLEVAIMPVRMGVIKPSLPELPPDLPSPPSSLPSPVQPIPNPTPAPIPVVPSPSPSPSLPPSPPSSPPPGDGGVGLVTWNVKFGSIPRGTIDYMYLEYHIAVSRDDVSSIFRHYETRQSASFVLSPEDLGAGIEVSVVVVSVSVTKTSLSKTWNVLAIGIMSGILYVNENVSITAPPFNGQGEPNIFWNDIQTHTV